MGRILRILRVHYRGKAPLIGSLNTLYNGVANLDSVHFKAGELTEDMLLNPESVYADRFSALKINLNRTHEPAATSYPLKNKSSFIITNDLRVMPNIMTCSIIDALTDLGIDVTDMEGAETMHCTFGLNQIMDLLMKAFISRDPLTDTILGNAQMKSEMQSFMFDKFEEEDSSANLKKAMMKVMLQKSTNKFLFAQTNNHFIDYLVSILTIPLGRVEWLLNGNTGLHNIDNLYRTIAKHNINSIIGIDWLNRPRLPEKMYTSNQLLPLSEECFVPCMRHNGKGNFINEGPRMFMVTDNLVVTPMGTLTSSLSILNEMKISLSDVQELELHIGEKEALNILKASLTSTTALTDALELKKRVKQEY